MVLLNPADTSPKEAGVVYTKPWMVELVLDLAGYHPEKALAELVALEPSAGDGAFLSAMVRRLVDSCERHGTPMAKAIGALQAFEIDPQAAESAVEAVRETLVELSVAPSLAEKLARNWVKPRDFLEAPMCFPIADFVIGNPPYIRLEDIPERKAAMYRNGYSVMRGRADIYVAFYQAALMQLKPRGVCQPVVDWLTCQKRRPLVIHARKTPVEPRVYNMPTIHYPHYLRKRRDETAAHHSLSRAAAGSAGGLRQRSRLNVRY